MAEIKRGMKAVDSLGATGQTVRDNVRHRREKQRLSFAELSRRTSEAGRELSSLALRRIEEGARRVDVDDLMVLAVALKTSPIQLLLPPAHPREVVPATAVPAGVRVGELRRWAANLLDGARGRGIDREDLIVYWRNEVGTLEANRDGQEEALQKAQAALDDAIGKGQRGDAHAEVVASWRKALASTEQKLAEAEGRLAELRAQEA